MTHTPNCTDIPFDVRVDAVAGQPTDDVGIHKKDMYTDAHMHTYAHINACVWVCVCLCCLFKVFASHNSEPRIV